MEAPKNVMKPGLCKCELIICCLVLSTSAESAPLYNEGRESPRSSALKAIRYDQFLRQFRHRTFIDIPWDSLAPREELCIEEVETVTSNCVRFGLRGVLNNLVIAELVSECLQLLFPESYSLHDAAGL